CGGSGRRTGVTDASDGAFPVLDRVPGQEHAIAFLRQAAARPHHAYVLAGPEGGGKQLAARAFAAGLLCKGGGGGGCRGGRGGAGAAGTADWRSRTVTRTRSSPNPRVATSTWRPFAPRSGTPPTAPPPGAA